MKSLVFKSAGFAFFGLSLLVLVSCTPPQKTVYISQEFDPASITTIGLFPITYDEKYGPPLRSDIRGSDLSKMITRQIEKVLTNKGYKLRSVDLPTKIAKSEPFVPLNVEPSVLGGNASPDIDGLMQVHVTFHYGIYPRDNSSDNGSDSRINIFASVRMIDNKNLAEVFRDSGRARPLITNNFQTRLNYAVYSLAEGLLKNFPDRK